MRLLRLPRLLSVLLHAYSQPCPPATPSGLQQRACLMRCCPHPRPSLAGMNSFLKNLEITFRRDPTNYRPRINKKESTKDREQKLAGTYYYREGCWRGCCACMAGSRAAGPDGRVLWRGCGVAGLGGGRRGSELLTELDVLPPAAVED